MHDALSSAVVGAVLLMGFVLAATVPSSACVLTAVLPWYLLLSLARASQDWAARQVA